MYWIVAYDGSNLALYHILYSQLTNVRAGDTYPRFAVQHGREPVGYTYVFCADGSLGISPIKMLTHTNVLINGYLCNYVPWNTATPYINDSMFRYVCGKPWSYYPWVSADNVASVGGYKRGRFPWPITLSVGGPGQIEPWQPIDVTYTWRRSNSHLIIPMAGQYDPEPLLRL